MSQTEPEAAAVALPGLPKNDDTAATPAEPAAPETPPAAETPEKEKKPTAYVILVSETEAGPFQIVGTFSGFGQVAAKKLAGAKLVEDNVDVAALYFAAVPSGSWSPEKPTVKHEPTISF